TAGNDRGCRSSQALDDDRDLTVMGPQCIHYRDTFVDIPAAGIQADGHILPRQAGEVVDDVLGFDLPADLAEKQQFAHGTVTSFKWSMIWAVSFFTRRYRAFTSAVRSTSSTVINSP